MISCLFKKSTRENNFFVRASQNFFATVVFTALGMPLLVFASTTIGTIDATYKYAKGVDSNVGRINFGLSQGAVTITDTAITGYVWGEHIGWINLAPTTAGVLNNGEGTLSGYAWGELAGWINFAPSNGGVTINSSGDFLGYAWSQNFGWIIFNCATNSSCGTDNFKVVTDWRPASTRQLPSPPPSSSGSVTPPPPAPALTSVPTPDPTPEPTTPEPTPLPPSLPTPIPQIRKVERSIDKAREALLRKVEESIRNADKALRDVAKALAPKTATTVKGSRSGGSGDGVISRFLSSIAEKVDSIVVDVIARVYENTKKVVLATQEGMQKIIERIARFSETPASTITTNTVTTTAGSSGAVPSEGGVNGVSGAVPSEGGVNAVSGAVPSEGGVNAVSGAVPSEGGVNAVSGGGGEAPSPLSEIAKVAAFVGEEIIARVYENTKKVVLAPQESIQKAKERITEFSETPVGAITTNTVTTLGVASGSVVIASSLAGSAFSIPDILLNALRLWSVLLASLGLRRRHQSWGTVYDSVTKQPIDPAYVVLEDLTGKEIATSITDLDGRFGFLVPAGVYRIIANKTNYIAPSKNLLGKNHDELYENLYFGEDISIGAEEVITKNIPMDPEKFDWNEFAKRDKKLMMFYSKNTLMLAKVSNTLFFAGLVFAVVFFASKPDVHHASILGLYAVLFALHMFGLKPKPYGMITDSNTGFPLSFAVVRVFPKGSEKELFHRIADKYGHYYCLLSKGEYYVTIERKNDDQSYTLVYTSDVINAKNGIIDTNFLV